MSFGVARSARPQQNFNALREFLVALEVAPFDEHCAQRYGMFRAASERVGKPIGSFDALIAAHAVKPES